MSPQIVQVIPQPDYSVYVYFEDGKIVSYDVSPLLSKGVFKVLQDKNIFINACTILNDTLAWDINGTRSTYDCIDIDPDTLYELPHIKEKTA